MLKTGFGVARAPGVGLDFDGVVGELDVPVNAFALLLSVNCKVDAFAAFPNHDDSFVEAGVTAFRAVNPVHASVIGYVCSAIQKRLKF